MKCTKCGFVNFDYVSECKKCGIDLSFVRNGLGFLGVKPELPFHLTALLEDLESSALGGGQQRAPQKADASLPEIEFGDELDLDADIVFADDDLLSPAAGMPGAGKNVAQATLEEDFDLGADIVFDDEELGGIEKTSDSGSLTLENDLPESRTSTVKADKKPSGDTDDFDFEIDFALEDNAASEPPAGAEAVQPLENTDEELTITFDEDDFQLPKEEEAQIAKDKQDFSDDLDLDIPTGLTMEDDVLAKPSGKDATKAPGEEDAADDLVIELSENDLESLLMELDDVPEPTAKKDTTSARKKK